MSHPAPTSAEYIASLCLHSPQHFPIQLQSTAHRLAILNALHIAPGSRVLEIGCGQGDCTAALAALVGEGGHVTAVDPGALDYGAPATLGQAQAHISAGPLGPRITWVQADPIAFLSSTDETTTWDVAVLVLCTWYFPTADTVRATLAALRARVRRVCVAEWGLASAAGRGQTHVLAALAQAALEAHNPAPESNIRVVVAPAELKRLAGAAGLALLEESVVEPRENVLDGRWEVGEVVSEGFGERVQTLVRDERQRGVIVALRDAVIAGVERVGGLKNVRSMDVWCAAFGAGHNS
ncbi:putative SAM-dependent methyltransferase [Dentipellis sp. KUC8613]|nr:putative SAM-dependent methyltransferase [Dentipellis sp. KUC8613]